MNDKPRLSELEKTIKEFDHGKKIPKTGRNRLKGEFVSGFHLIFAIFAIMFVAELWFNLSLEHFGIICLIILYILYEIYNFRNYDQTKIIGN